MLRTIVETLSGLQTDGLLYCSGGASGNSCDHFHHSGNNSVLGNGAGQEIPDTDRLRIYDDCSITGFFLGDDSVQHVTDKQERVRDTVEPAAQAQAGRYDGRRAVNRYRESCLWEDQSYDPYETEKKITQLLQHHFQHGHGFCDHAVLLTRSSFLYAFNNWDDTNSYFSMGKAIFPGMVPYRDLFDQKGILLYMLYGMASLISYRSFAGVFIIEILAAAGMILALLQLQQLYISRKLSYILTPVMAAAIYASRAFWWGGSAEEMMLPLLAWGLFSSLLAILEKLSTTGTVSDGF